MKRVLKQKIIGLLSIICLLSLSLFVFSFNVIADQAVWNGLDEVKELYNLGDEFEIPDVILSVGGGNASAEVQLTSPDGTNLTQGTVLLDKVGYYELQYTAEVGGVEYSDGMEFYVADKNFTSTNAGDVLKEDTITYYPQGVETHNAKGVIAELQEGSVLTCNQIVNLNSLGADVSIINAVIIPEVGGVPDFKAFEFRLTDAHNPDNFIVVRVDYQATSWAYYKTRTSNRERLVGTGDTGYLAYGAGGQLNFMNFEGATSGVYQRQIKFYYSNKTIYMSNDGTKKAILDFSDSAIYTRSGLAAEFVEWNGFTTGEVYVSLQALNLQGENPNPARFFITEIGGESVPFNIMDIEAPKIDVLLEGQVEGEIYGAINKEFTLFDATVTDNTSENLTAKVKVFKDYGLITESQIAVIGGKFIPEDCGVYTIEYTATDWSRNTTVKSVEVEVIEVIWTGLQSILDEYIIGDELDLPAVFAEGAGGAVAADVQIIKPNGAIVNDETVLLDKVGYYIILCSVEIEQNIFSTSIEFYVKGARFNSTVSGDQVSDDIITYYPMGVVTENAQGVIAELQQGSVLTCDKIINLNSLGGNVSVINAVIIPEVGGVPDFKAFEFRLTDAHNPDNFIVVRVDYQATSTAYYKTRTSNRGLLVGTGDTGYLASGAGGQLNFMNFDGSASGQYQRPIKFYFSNKTIYMSNDGPKKAILDFSDSAIYTRSGLAAEFVEWNGFTTGEVYVSLEALSYQGDNPARFFITEIGGESARYHMRDNKAPSIDVALGGQSESNITAYTNKEFTIFSATATDNTSEDLTVSAKVYKNYGLSNQTEIAFEGGAFIPNELGQYTIEYKSTDWSRNTAVKTITINVDKLYGGKIIATIQEDDLVLNTDRVDTDYSYQYWIKRKVETDIFEGVTKTNYIWELARPYNANSSANLSVDDDYEIEGKYEVICRIKNLEGDVVEELYGSFAISEIGFPVIESVSISERVIKDNSIVVTEKVSDLAINVTSNVSGQNVNYYLLYNDVVLSESSDGNFTLDLTSYNAGAGNHSFKVMVTNGSIQAFQYFTLFVYDTFVANERPFIENFSGAPENQEDDGKTVFTMEVAYVGGNNISLEAAEDYEFSISTNGKKLVAKTDDISVIEDVLTVRFYVDYLNKHGVYHTIATVTRKNVNVADDKFNYYYEYARDSYVTQTAEIIREGAENIQLSGDVYSADINDELLIKAVGGYIGDVQESDLRYAFYREDANGWILIKDYSTDNELYWTPLKLGIYKIQARIKDVNGGSWEYINSKDYLISDNVLSGDSDITFTDYNTGEEVSSLIVGNPYIIKANFDETEAVLYRYTLYTRSLGIIYLSDYSSLSSIIFIPNKVEDYQITVRVIKFIGFGYKETSSSVEISALLS